MVINLNLIPIFVNHRKTLQVLSSDNHNQNVIDTQYMTDSSELAIAFDDVKEEYEFTHCNKIKNAFSSVDAILQFDTMIYFIEFKNGQIKNRVEDQIHNKISDTILIFNELMHTTIDFERKNVEFILVYNEKKNRLTEKEETNNISNSPHFSSLSRSVNLLGNNHLVRFKMHRFVQTFFLDVYTMDEGEFKNFLIEHNLRIS